MPDDGVDYYDVAVYWGSQGYGGATRCRTLMEAKKIADHLASPQMGYGTPKNAVHIIKKREPRIVMVISDRPAKAKEPK